MNKKGNRRHVTSKKSAMFSCSARAFFLVLCRCVDECACTEMFAMAAVTIVDQGGAPVDSLDISVENTMTRVSYDVSAYNSQVLAAEGQYVVFHDGFVQSIHAGGEDVTVRAFRDTALVAAGEFVFGTDACRCHIQKLSGPDTLVASFSTLP
jgi:hypothetical protein